VFRRRRTDSGQSGNEPEGMDSGLGEPEPGPDDGGSDIGGPGDGGPGEPEPGAGEASPEAAGLAGPWDAGDDVPRQERIDFGSLLVPSGEGMEIQVSVVENQPAWITVMHGKSGLQLQAFAAPKSGGLWDEVRQEIAAEVARSGGQSTEADGPFGVELRARITPADPVHGGRRGALEPVRFLGMDGPRWFLRGLISGPAATHEDLARPLERVFAAVVVVRGDHPVPPRDLLEIRLPDEALQELGQEPPAPGEEGRWPLNPFERGPEITETR
jgi:Protein of unknown function (DUF3710)